MKILDRYMDNTTASLLGVVALNAGKPDRVDIGDSIDRGLILLRLLNEAGFDIVQKEKNKNHDYSIYWHKKGHDHTSGSLPNYRYNQGN